ncbi:hypothetical protein [Francisella philomiragia]|uniref:hypothetical protein n=1 Tax=Francisella philomiragia TaxID=28110 RepID=UPI0035179953
MLLSFVVDYSMISTREQFNLCIYEIQNIAASQLSMNKEKLKVMELAFKCLYIKFNRRGQDIPTEFTLMEEISKLDQDIFKKMMNVKSQNDIEPFMEQVVDMQLDNEAKYIQDMILSETDEILDACIRTKASQREILYKNEKLRAYMPKFITISLANIINTTPEARNFLMQHQYKVVIKSSGSGGKENVFINGIAEFNQFTQKNPVNILKQYFNVNNTRLQISTPQELMEKTIVSMEEIKSYGVTMKGREVSHTYRDIVAYDKGFDSIALIPVFSTVTSTTDSHDIGNVETHQDLIHDYYNILTAESKDLPNSHILRKALITNSRMTNLTIKSKEQVFKEIAKTVIKEKATVKKYGKNIL